VTFTCSIIIITFPKRAKGGAQPPARHRQVVAATLDRIGVLCMQLGPYNGESRVPHNALHDAAMRFPFAAQNYTSLVKL
jgi:hypothetical protein